MAFNDRMSGSHFIVQTSKYFLINATVGESGGREMKT